MAALFSQRSVTVFLFLPSVLLFTLLSHGGEPLVHLSGEGGVLWCWGNFCLFPYWLSQPWLCLISLLVEALCTNQFGFFRHILNSFVFHEVFPVYSKLVLPQIRHLVHTYYGFSYEHSQQVQGPCLKEKLTPNYEDETDKT